MEKFHTTRIEVTSRASVKIKDSYYTFECALEKTCSPEESLSVKQDEVDMIKKSLWDEANTEVDNQINEVVSILNCTPKR